MTSALAPQCVDVVIARVSIPISEVQGMFEIILELMKALPDNPSRNGDWACVECKPHSDMQQEGFQCAWHKAKAFLKRYGVGDE